MVRKSSILVVLGVGILLLVGCSAKTPTKITENDLLLPLHKEVRNVHLVEEPKEVELMTHLVTEEKARDKAESLLTEEMRNDGYTLRLRTSEMKLGDEYYHQYLVENVDLTLESTILVSTQELDKVLIYYSDMRVFSPKLDDVFGEGWKQWEGNYTKSSENGEVKVVFKEQGISKVVLGVMVNGKEDIIEGIPISVKEDTLVLELDNYSKLQIDKTKENGINIIPEDIRLQQYLEGVYINR